MKKLMIAAAAAAMIGVTYANTCVEGECETTGGGTAHKVTISLKALKLKSKSGYDKSTCETGCTYWYEQSSLKICGNIWGELDDCNVCTASFEDQRATFYTTETSLPIEFGIAVGLIGKPDSNGDTKKIQAYGIMTGEYGEMAWAGFGTLTTKSTKKECEEGTCSSWVKSISGNIAGRVQKPEYVEICDVGCDPVEYTGCCDDMQCEYASAYGTIKISYDSTGAKSIAKLVAAGESDITVDQFAKLPKGVSAAEAAENTFDVIIEE